MSGTIAGLFAWAHRLHAHKSIGYSQGRPRWSLLTSLNGGSIAKGKTAADCSSLAGAIVMLAGYTDKLDRSLATKTWVPFARRIGFKVIAYRSPSQVKPGDFLLTPGRHMVFVMDDGRYFEARLDENGRTTGGQPGDQNGKEVWIRAPYTPSYGWRYILRPPADTTQEEEMGTPEQNANAVWAREARDGRSLGEILVSLPSADEIATAIWAQKVGDPERKDMSYGTAGGLLARADMRAFKAAVRSGEVLDTPGGVDIDALAAEIRDGLGDEVAAALAKKLAK